MHLVENKIKVDLIYLDPPFNSSRTYNIIFKSKGSTAQQVVFHDMWTITAQTRQMVLDFNEIIETSNEISIIVKDFLRAWISPLQYGTVQDKKMLVYLVYMTERLILMKRVLKDTGSIYFHCDPTASHYIKIIMDGLFNRENFRNEIVWCYSNSGRAKSNFASKHDIILFYSMTNNFFWGDYRIPISEKYLESHYNQKDKKGRRCRIRTDFGKTRIYYPETGMTCNDWWADIPSLNSMAKERLGYTTQKPIELLNRIIEASCPENGVVLDPFCGCGTTVHSAIANKRKWIGVDISSNATNVIKDRIKALGSFENKDYQFIDGSPATKKEYEGMNPFEKQDWLVRKVGGFPNPKKSGDGGVDGEMTLHLGFKKDKNLDKTIDHWGKMVFSVKTGSQCKPEFIRELIGTMKLKNAEFGGLILEAEPSENMEVVAQNKGQFIYRPMENMPPQYHDCVQIRTVQQIIDGDVFDVPPTLENIKLYRNKQGLLQV